MAGNADNENKRDAEPRAPEKNRQGKVPGSDNSPGQGGFHHADTRMGHEHSKLLGEAERVVTGKKKPPESADMDEIDKAKE
jgi:hypothetical protein